MMSDVMITLAGACASSANSLVLYDDRAVCVMPRCVEAVLLEGVCYSIVCILLGRVVPLWCVFGE